MNLIEKLKNSTDGKKYFRKREEVLRWNKNCEAWIDSDGNLQATSFSWWNVVHCKNGLYFFNWYSYSSYTSRHQSKIRKLMNEMGLDYISVSYSGHGSVNSLGLTSELGGYSKNTLQNVSINQILLDKINSLYMQENAQFKKREGAHPVYSEEQFNETLSDIHKIAAAMKLKPGQLEKMMIDAETRAMQIQFDDLFDESERKDTRKEAAKRMLDFQQLQFNFKGI